MKIITLILGVMICALKPALAMELKNEKQIVACKPYKIPDYETLITCTSCLGSRLDFTEINFDVQNSNREKIGEILTQYYPTDNKYYETSTAPVVRLRWIEIEKNYQRNYHGTRAMETLITTLRKSPVLPRNAEMWLEYSSFEPHLAKFYESFGFKETNEHSAFETRIMKVALTETKFPYYAKHKKLKETK